MLHLNFRELAKNLFIRHKKVLTLMHGGFTRTFGWSKNLVMPSEGLLYIVEFLENDESRILAYADKAKRIFITSQELSISPAQTPDMYFKRHPLYYQTRGSIERKESSGAYTQVASYEHIDGRFILQDSKLDSLIEDTNTSFELEDALVIAFIGLSAENRDLIDAQAQEHSIAQTQASQYFYEFLSETHSIQTIMSELNRYVNNIQARENLGRNNARYPSASELYSKRLILESSILQANIDPEEYKILARFLLVEDTGLLYAVFSTNEVSASLRLWAMMLESIFNRLMLSKQAAQSDPSEEELAQIDLDLIESIAKQSPAFLENAASYDYKTDPYASWDARLTFSGALASLSLPYRLETDFRLPKNLSRSIIHIRIPEIELMPQLRYSPSLDTWLVQTHSELEVARTRYVARLVHLVASCFFASSRYTDQLSIQTILLGEDREYSLGSFSIKRGDLFKDTKLAHQDPHTFILKYGQSLEYQNKILVPSTDIASLKDPAFFNSEAYKTVERLDEQIPEIYQGDLYAQHTSELAIVEGATRLHYAIELIGLNIQGSTQERVGKLLELLKQFDDSDEDLNHAVQRTIAGLIDGSLENASSIQLAQNIISGSNLSVALMKASLAFTQGKVEEAYEIAKAELDALEANEPYRDTDDIAWRYFSTYSERILYNKYYAHDTREVRLVPDAYFEIYMLAALCLISLNNLDQAYRVLLRALNLNPLNGRVRLRLAHLLKLQDKPAEAIEQLKIFLSRASIPIGIGLAYFNLGQYLWEENNPRAALVSYTLSSRYPSPVQEEAAKRLDELVRENPSLENFDFESELYRLETLGIHVAPNKITLEVLQNAAKACVALEYFAPAHQIVAMIGPILRDDRLFLLAQSLGD